jgi:hypothetical protein
MTRVFSLKKYMARRTNHLMTGHLKTKMTIIGVFGAIFWIVEILNQFVFDHQLNGSSVCVMQWTGVIRDGTLI